MKPLFYNLPSSRVGGDEPIILFRAFTFGLPNGICKTDLALKPKKPPTPGLVKV